MTTTVSIDDIAVTTIDGRETTVAEFAGPVRLIVNVASKCGFTPQYEALEALHRRYGDRGLVVLGFPTNQFLQERGDEGSIAEFCRTTYGVTFPMFAKVKVNGRSAHPLFAELTRATDDAGKAGRVGWNFEKFILLPDGQVRRFRSTIVPDDPTIIALLEEHLPG